MTSAYVRCQLYNFSGARASLDQIEIPPGNRFEVDAHIILAQIEFREGHAQKAIDLLQQSELDLNRHPHGNLLVFANLAEYLLSVGDTRGSEDALRKSVGLILIERHFGLLYVAATCARYAAAFAAQSGHADLAVRLLAMFRNMSPSHTKWQLTRSAISYHANGSNICVLRVLRKTCTSFSKSFSLSRLRPTTPGQARHRAPARPP
jgi:hypothetical protein